MIDHIARKAARQATRRALKARRGIGLKARHQTKLDRQETTATMTITTPPPAYIQRHPKGDLIRVPCSVHGKWHTHGYADDPIGLPLDRSSHCHQGCSPARRPAPLPFDRSARPVLTSEPFRSEWITPHGRITAAYLRHVTEGIDPR